MINKRSIIVSILAALVFLAGRPIFAESVAFAFFSNKSDKASLNYLKEVLPNTIASSLNKKYNISARKPSNVDFLSKYAEGDDSIPEKVLRPLSPELVADFFIFGYFEDLNQNKIRISTKIYSQGSNEVFTFIEEGDLGTDMFNLVDKIAYRINNIISYRQYFKDRAIEPKARISIITNLEGEELNICYSEFLKNGYRVFSSVGNELKTEFDYEKMNYLYTFYTTNAQYEKIAYRSEIFLAHGTWSGAKYYRDLLKERDIYNKYAFEYGKTISGYINKVRNDNLFDYSLIISVDKDTNKAWVRCISIKDFKLVYLEKNIDALEIDQLARKIIMELSTNMPEKF